MIGNGEIADEEKRKIVCVDKHNHKASQYQNQSTAARECAIGVIAVKRTFVTMIIAVEYRERRE